VAAVLSGAPSTLFTLVDGGDILDSTRAVGRVFLRRPRHHADLVAGALAHVALSLGWGVVLAAALPRRRTIVAGTAAGAGIAALDLGLIGRRLPTIRALAWRPQLLDHLAYGAIVGAVLSRRRSTSPERGSGAAGSTP
jgi:hypothetical protein